MQTPAEKLVAFLSKNPNASKTALSEGTGLTGLVLFNGLKSLQKAAQIIVQGEGADAMYSLSENVSGENNTGQNDGKEKPATDLEIPIVINQPAVVEKTKAKKGATRDSSKFHFNGLEYGKGALARAILVQWVTDNPGATYKKMKEMWPDTLMKRFGLVQDIETARQISGKKYDRYFFKEEHQITLKDKTICVVTNQWTLENLQPFIKLANELGYTITT